MYTLRPIMQVIEVSQGGGLHNLLVRDRTDPQPQANEVIVRWHATSLNYHDYLVAAGAIPVQDGRIPMSDGAGEIIATGEDVSQWQTGDKVMSTFFPFWHEGRPSLRRMAVVSGETVDGYMAEKSAIPASSISAIPTGLSYAEAATLPCAGLTAWRGLIVEGKIKAGDKVLIEGTGGMSIMGLQLAQMAGAQVYATTSSASKAERLKDMGVDIVIDYTKDHQWGKSIYKLTDGGVDHVLDVGGGSTMNQSIEAAAIGGHIVSIGILSDGRKGSITFPKLFFKQLTLSGIAVGSRAMQEDMTRAININGLKPFIDTSFAFDQLGEAFRYQQSGQHFGKIILEW